MESPGCFGYLLTGSLPVDDPASKLWTYASRRCSSPPFSFKEKAQFASACRCLVACDLHCSSRPLYGAGEGAPHYEELGNAVNGIDLTDRIDSFCGGYQNGLQPLDRL